MQIYVMFLVMQAIKKGSKEAMKSENAEVTQNKERNSEIK